MPPKKHIRSPQPGNVGERIKPRESGSGSSDVLAPIFCLRHVAHGWGVDACEREDQAAFALTLQRLARLTWQQIRNAPRHGVGTEKIARTALRAGVPATITDDVDFLALRFSGKKPMVGFRSNEVFHVVWLDRSFSLYDHG